MASSFTSQEQEIQRIKSFLMDGFPENTSRSTPASNNILTDNVDNTRTIGQHQQQIEPINNNNNNGSSILHPQIHMDVDDVYKEPEQISSNDQQPFDHLHENDNNTIHHEQILKPSTTDNTNTNEQSMSAYEYCNQLLQIYMQNVEKLKPELIKLGISIKTADSYLKNLPIPLPSEINITTQDPLIKLSDLFQTGLNLLPSFRQICYTDNHNHTDPVGEELHETTERATSVPSEHNGSRLSQKIQLPSKQPKVSRLTNNPSILSLCLSKLIEKAKMIAEQANLFQLVVSGQPQQFWKTRTINCLKKKWCTAIQDRSGSQRQGIGIKWSTLTNANRMNLFVLVQLLSYDNHLHQTNVLVPAGTKVKEIEISGQKKRKVNRRSTLDDLIIDDMYGFERKTRTILCPVTEQEYDECKKSLQVIMFSLYKTNNEIDSSDDGQDSVDNEDNEKNISVKDELNKLSKLRICLCQRNNNGELEPVSNYVDTELIEQSKGTKSLAIERSGVTPAQLCQCGNETITVTLNTDSEKNGFAVCLNNNPIDLRQIRGVTKKQLCFNSCPRKTPEQTCLNLKISKKSISKTIELDHDPYINIDENILLDINLVYVEHSNNPHEHKN